MWTDIADQLSAIDPDKKVVIYCYTGHTGGDPLRLAHLEFLLPA